MAYLGLLPSALGFVIWGYAVARLPLAVSTAALYLVPPVALLVSYVWLSEVPRLLEVAGGVVIILGAVLINRRSSAGAPAPGETSDAPLATSRPTAHTNCAAPCSR